ncbi:TM2 domain-containing protein [Paenibacillus arenosi]|uniref:TM2 domain-containing protein n=1 Tax=Paenibacillus arenosi TaxID=2774142 RepID=A0ABR9AWC6_9BACL|nr:TM2 domain-containing protein [Paenibacillus arenosi]MBD8498405.1 TM2 domain-containing protein [Paenibacillus arenosi]
MIAFQHEYEKRAKSKMHAVIFWLFLGPFGAHRFYLGEKASGVLLLFVGLCFYIVLPISLFVFAVNTFDPVNPGIDSNVLLILFLLILFIGLIWWVIEGFLISGKVDRLNEKLEMDIMRQIVPSKVNSNSSKVYQQRPL